MTKWETAEIRFSADWPYNQVLTCPACGEGNLHHRTVTIYDRNEDGPETVTTVHRNETVPSVTGGAPGSGGDNPSERRHGLSIAFECEHCHVVPELTLAQHKGTSILEWRFQPAPKNPGLHWLEREN